jgi:uncharacterized protein with HEPN domain
MRSDAERVRDILEAIERIQRHTAAGRRALTATNSCRHGSCTISRSSARPPPVSDEWRRDHPDVPVRGIVGMRNALAHGYFEIDADAVWNVVERDLPVLAGRLSSVKEPARHDTGQDDRAARAFDADMRRGLQTLGGVGTAKRLLREDRYSEGFTTLWEKGRLEMSVEFFVLLPWSHRCSMTPSATPPRWDVS